MKLIDTEPLAHDLQEGLPQVHEHTRAFEGPFRLSMQVCALASVAIAEHLVSRGITARVISSQPHIDIDPTLEHVMVMVHHEGQTGVIDPTYTQFLGYAGLTPAYVRYGGRNAFPREKIASFTAGEHQSIVTRLSLISESYMNQYTQIIAGRYTSPETVPFEGMDDVQIEERLSEIWNPNNWRAFEPSPETLDAGLSLSRFIVPEHVKLVA